MLIREQAVYLINWKKGKKARTPKRRQNLQFKIFSQSGTVKTVPVHFSYRNQGSSILGAMVGIEVGVEGDRCVIAAGTPRIEMNSESLSGPQVSPSLSSAWRLRLVSPTLPSLSPPNFHRSLSDSYVPLLWFRGSRRSARATLLGWLPNIWLLVIAPR